MTRTTAVALMLIMWALGAIAGATLTWERQPYCPTEDSCTIDYHDGQWTVTEEQP